jgi:hypothetical protein
MSIGSFAFLAGFGLILAKPAEPDDMEKFKQGFKDSVLGETMNPSPTSGI